MSGVFIFQFPSSFRQSFPARHDQCATTRPVFFLPFLCILKTCFARLAVYFMISRTRAVSRPLMFNVYEVRDTGGFCLSGWEGYQWTLEIGSIQPSPPECVLKLELLLRVAVWTLTYVSKHI